MINKCGGYKKRYPFFHLYFLMPLLLTLSEINEWTIKRKARNFSSRLTMLIYSWKMFWLHLPQPNPRNVILRHFCFAFPDNFPYAYHVNIKVLYNSKCPQRSLDSKNPMVYTPGVVSLGFHTQWILWKLDNK